MIPQVSFLGLHYNWCCVCFFFIEFQPLSGHQTTPSGTLEWQKATRYAVIIPPSTPACMQAPWRRTIWHSSEFLPPQFLPALQLPINHGRHAWNELDHTICCMARVQSSACETVSFNLARMRLLASEVRSLKMGLTVLNVDQAYRFAGIVRKLSATALDHWLNSNYITGLKAALDTRDTRALRMSLTADYGQCFSRGATLSVSRCMFTRRR